MGRGKSLTVEEKAKIYAYDDQGLSGREISLKINKSANVVWNYLRNKEKYGKNMKGRQTMATTATERRNILRIASNSSDSAAKIKEKSGSSASLSTVRRIINAAEHLKRIKLQKKPPLNQQRKELRLNFCKEHMTWKSEWNKVVFSDEKKFNFDGPDGFNYYFHDLRKEERFLARRHSRVGGVMVWGAISFYGGIDLEFQTTKMTANSYQSILQTAFPKFQDLFGPIPWTFQQDNAPIHTARIIKSWISEQNVELLPWPPYSPDINIMENVWGWLSRKVYESGRQFDDRESLIAAIKSAWSQISLQYLSQLYNSLPNRIYEVILSKGGSTHY